MNKKFAVFVEEVNKRRILIDFKNGTFIIYNKGSIVSSGFWNFKGNGGKLRIFYPKSGKEELLLIKGVILSCSKDDKDEKSIVIVRKEDNIDKEVIFSYQDKEIIVNTRDNVFSVEKGKILGDGCYNFSEGSIIIDPLIIGEKYKKHRLVLRIRALILQKEDGKNLIFKKK